MTERKLPIDIFPSATDIPENMAITPLIQHKYLCNGEMREWHGPSQEVFSPVYLNNNGSLQQVALGSYPILGEPESMEALNAAVKAYDNGRGEWPTMPVTDRIKCMETFLKLMIEQREEVVKLIVWEIGKSVADSYKEFDRTIDYIKLTIEAYKDIDRNSSKFEITQGVIGQIRRAPLGVVLCMGPFNYPLNETYATLIPALITGNTILFKPPKYGVLLHFPLLEAFRKAFPAGVVNTIYGRGNNIIPGLMSSGKVDVLALIGSSRVADTLKKLHPKTNRLRAILGLDAKNMGIVLSNADIPSTVKEIVAGALTFNGQRCTAIKIIFVHKAVREEFINRLNEEVDSLTMGMPWDKNVFITPLPEPNKPEYLKECIEDAVARGAAITNNNGGAAQHSMVKPAVLFPVKPGMKVWTEEQFGPIIPVAEFEHIEEPIEYLIESHHGQQVSIFGEDPDELAALIDPLVNQVCRVNINAQCQRSPDTFPFTGRKDSAEGTLSVADALRSFTIRTMVAAKFNESNKKLLNAIVHERKSKFLSTDFIF